MNTFKAVQIIFMRFFLNTFNISYTLALLALRIFAVVKYGKDIFKAFGGFSGDIRFYSYTF